MKPSTTLTLSGTILIIVGIVTSIFALIQAYNIESYENTLQGKLSSLLNGCYYTNQLNTLMDISWVGIFITIGGVVLVLIGAVVYLMER